MWQEEAVVQCYSKRMKKLFLNAFSQHMLLKAPHANYKCLKVCIDNVSLPDAVNKKLQLLTRTEPLRLLNVFQLPARAQLLWDWQMLNDLREGRAWGWRWIYFGGRTKAASVGDWNARVVVWQMVIIFFLPTFVPLIAVHLEFHYSCMSRPTSRDQTPVHLKFRNKKYDPCKVGDTERRGLLSESIWEINQHSCLVFNSSCLCFLSRLRTHSPVVSKPDKHRLQLNPLWLPAHWECGALLWGRSASTHTRRQTRRWPACAA